MLTTNNNVTNPLTQSPLWTPPTKGEQHKRAHIIARRLAIKNMAGIVTKRDSLSTVLKISSLSKCIKKTKSQKFSNLNKSVKMHGISLSQRRLSIYSPNESTSSSQFYSSTQDTSADKDEELTSDVSLDLNKQMYSDSLLSILEEGHSGELRVPIVEVADQMGATSQMNNRVNTALQLQLPKVDYLDIHESRQFAPEYSQKAYESAKAEERALGDYFEECEQSYHNTTSAHRREMVCLIENLHTQKKYRIETLYLAVNIADRYLIKTFASGKPVPNLVLLALTSIMIAAKAGQPLKPSYALTASMLPETLQSMVSKNRFMELESEMLVCLEFELSYISPITFLERYQRLYGLDNEQSDAISCQINSTALHCCKLMQRESHYLRYKPSQLAAASLVFAYNMNTLNSNIDTQQSQYYTQYTLNKLRSMGLVKDNSNA